MRTTATVVFTDPARGAAYAEAMSGPGLVGVEESVVRIDSAAIPQTIQGFHLGPATRSLS